MSLKEIARLTGLHRNTVGKCAAKLERDGLVAVSRKIGNAKLYRLSIQAGAWNAKSKPNKSNIH